MIPCKYCGEWCGGTCVKAKSALSKAWAKEVAFAQIYGGGMGGSPFKPKVDHANQTVDGKPKEMINGPYHYSLHADGSLYDSYGNPIPAKQESPLVKAPDPALPDALKDHKGQQCLDCANFTWKKGWHYSDCQYHLPLGQCPVPSHTECADARKALGQTLKGYSWHVTPTAKVTNPTFDIETTGMKGHTPIVEIMDEISDYASAKEKKPVKYDHSVYVEQLFSYAAHHGISRKQAWDNTLGKISEHHGYGWTNPYMGDTIPGLKKADAPYWPNLLFSFGGACSCSLCQEQMKLLLPSEKKPLDDQVLGYLKNDAKASLKPWATASSSEILKNLTDAKKDFEKVGKSVPADPYNGYPAPTLKALAELFDEYLEYTHEAKEFAKKLSQGDMFLLTGKKYPQHTQDQLFHAAMGIFSQYMEVDEDDEEWIKALFEKNHGTNKVPNLIVGKDVKIMKLDKDGKPTGEPMPLNFKTGQITFLDADYSTVETKAANYLAHEKAASQMAAYYDAGVVSHSEFATANQNIHAQPAGKYEELKPGDQVIVQVSEAGKLFVPEGMTALVMRK